MCGMARPPLLQCEKSAHDEVNMNRCRDVWCANDCCESKELWWNNDETDSWLIEWSIAQKIDWLQLPESPKSLIVRKICKIETFACSSFSYLWICCFSLFLKMIINWIILRFGTVETKHLTTELSHFLLSPPLFSNAQPLFLFRINPIIKKKS